MINAILSKLCMIMRVTDCSLKENISGVYFHLAQAAVAGLLAHRIGTVFVWEALKRCFPACLQLQAYSSPPLACPVC